MKNLLLIFTVSFLATLYACTNRQANTIENVSADTIQPSASGTAEPTAVEKQGAGLVLARDSGYILKKDGLRFLLSVALTDTSDSFWPQVKSNDTIGKFYRVKQTGNFFVCLIDLSRKHLFETHLLLEIKADGTVLKNERFIHGNYPCCWDNNYEGFTKRGNFYCIKTCGTGSGYCDAHIYLFKEIKAQDSQNSILESFWTSFSASGFSESLSSTIEWRDNYVLMHYKLEKGGFDINYKKFIAEQTERFDVKYILQNGTWVATDSTKLKGLDI